MTAEPFTLLGVDELAQLPDPRWLIDGVVPDGLSGLYGATGTAKSFLALDWALSVAAGITWFGHEVEQRWVVYIAAEGHAGLKLRVRAWAETRGNTDLSRVRFLPEAVNLLDGKQVARVRAALDSLPEKPGLLVVDTMARTMVGGDENSARDVGMFVDAVDGLRHGGAALVVHHTGHDGEHERGSSALRASVDFMAKMEREGRSPRLKLSCVKVKDAAEWPPIDLRLEYTAESCVLARVVEPEVAAEQEEQMEAEVLDFVRENGPASKRAIRAAIRGGNTRVDAAVRALEDQGLVKWSKRGCEACPDPPGTLGHAASGATQSGVPESGTLSRRESSSGHARCLDVPDGTGTVDWLATLPLTDEEREEAHVSANGDQPDALTAKDAFEPDPASGTPAAFDPTGEWA